MPRTADSATREPLVAAAVRLMLTKGYVATTVDDVCASARLTKGAFFHYFEDKEALAQAADRAMHRRELVVDSLTHYRRYVEGLLTPPRRKRAA